MPLPSRSGGAPLAPRPGWLGRVLVAVLGLNVVLAWLAIQGSLVLAHAVWLAAAGQVLAAAEPSRIAAQLALLRLGQVVLGLCAALLLLGWVHRAHRRLLALGVPGARSAREGLRDFLLPGANLVRIPRAIGALWRASAGPDPPAGVTAWVGWWWALSLATVLLDLAAVPPGRSLLAALGLGLGLPGRVLGECLRIAAVVLTIVVVTRIDRHQRDRRVAGAAVRGPARA